MAEWAPEFARRIGTAVQMHRKRREWTAARLADETAALGYPIHRVTIGKLESGNRGAKFDVAEILVLAAALDVPPSALVFHGLPDADLEIIPSVLGSATEALMWWSAEATLPGRSVPVRKAQAFELARLSRQLRALRIGLDNATVDQFLPNEDQDAVAKALRDIPPQIERLTNEIRDLGGDVLDET